MSYARLVGYIRFQQLIHRGQANENNLSLIRFNYKKHLTA